MEKAQTPDVTQNANNGEAKTKSKDKEKGAKNSV